MNKGTIELQKILESFKSMTSEEYTILLNQTQENCFENKYIININNIQSNISYNILNNTTNLDFNDLEIKNDKVKIQTNAFYSINSNQEVAKAA